jgi:hypothetical protein
MPKLTLSEFKASLGHTHPPSGSSPLLQSLWHEAKGDWNAAHELAQDVNTSEGAWVHGYLHLREGDQSNASYWYNRANQIVPVTSLEEEWEKIVRQLLGS